MAGAQPVNIRAYRHRTGLKTEIERQGVAELLQSRNIQKSTRYFSELKQLCLDFYLKDKAMQLVTVAFNHSLIQGMPRHGHFHVVNNDYSHLAVISVLYKTGEPDAFYDQIEEKLHELKTAPKVAAGVVELKLLQKRTGSYFRYVGSLTTPPCTENVIWNILGKVREISAEQLQLLMAPLPHKDNRPAQPLNGSTGQFYNPPNSTVSFQTI